jgi:hypothetical protein
VAPLLLDRHLPEHEVWERHPVALSVRGPLKAIAARSQK